MKPVTLPSLTYSESCLAKLPGLAIRGLRVSERSCLANLSRQISGRLESMGR